MINSTRFWMGLILANICMLLHIALDAYGFPDASIIFFYLCGIGVIAAGLTLLLDNT
jgi:hypothetical protein